MKIIYVSNVCSERKFEEFMTNCEEKPEQASQKFNFLTISGLAKNGYDVISISTLPVNRARSKKYFFRMDKDIQDSIEFFYLPIINIPGIKVIMNLIFTILFMIKLCIKVKGDKIFICDALNFSSSIGAQIVSYIFNLKTIGILTDIPRMMNYDTRLPDENLKKNIRSWIYLIYDKVLRNYTGYVFLTKFMAQEVGVVNKPNIVIEGMVNIEAKNYENVLSKKYEKKIIIYAGALRIRYGVSNLIEAFHKVENKQAELWLYGNGDMLDLISKYVELDKRIKYFGTISNDKVIKEELKSTLLVNPRPTNEEFTKYSFPSKNLEYMVSGTPILTTKLPGMPEEYLNYVYTFENEDIEEMTKKLEEILAIDNDKLYSKGAAAKKFVLENKNNIVQTKKIIDLINGLNGKEGGF